MPAGRMLRSGPEVSLDPVLASTPAASAVAGGRAAGLERYACLDDGILDVGTQSLAQVATFKHYGKHYVAVACTVAHRLAH
jgi:hypothetical protein